MIFSIIKSIDFSEVTLLLLMERKEATVSLGLAKIPFAAYSSGAHSSLRVSVKNSKDVTVGNVYLNCQFVSLMYKEAEKGVKVYI